MSGEKCKKWYNGHLRNYCLVIGILISITGGGWRVYAHLDDKIQTAEEQSYSRKEGEMLEKHLDKMDRKLDVLLGIKPMSSLDEHTRNDGRVGIGDPR